MPRIPFSRPLRRGLWIFGGALTLYALAGFLAVPALIRRQLPTRLSPVLKREVTLERVRFNPFTFSLTLEGFRVMDRDGSELFGFQRFYGNWELISLFQGGLHFKSIELREPRGHLQLLKEGRLNIADLMEGGAPTTASQPSKPLDLRIDTLWVDSARLQFEDRSRKSPFSTVVGPLSLLLRDFRTRRDHRTPGELSARTESGEAITWSGNFVTDPLGAEGRIRLEQLKLAKYSPYLQDQVGFELREGRLDLAFAYQFHWEPGREAVRLNEVQARVDGLVLGEAGRKEAALSLPRTEIRDGRVDALERKVELPLIRLSGGQVAVQREKSGQLNLERLFSTPPSPPDPKAKPLQLSLGRLDLDRFMVRFQDLVPPRPVSAELRDLDFRLENFSLDPAQSSRLSLSTRLGEASLSAQGQGRLLKTELSLEIQAKALDLRPYDAYLEPDLALRISSGQLELQGKVDLALLPGKAPRFAYRGDLALLRLEVMDAERREPFLRYEALRIKGLEALTGPERVSAASLRMEAPEHRIVVAADGTTNVGRAFKLAPEASPLATTVPPTRTTPSGEPMPLSIGRVEMDKGLLSFVDRSLKPEAALLITNLQGQYRGLSTRSDARSEVELKGLAGGLAPLSITGHAMPFRHDQDTDIRLRIQGAELMDFNPYAMKYLGYTIRKGKLDTDAHIQIQKRQLKSQTHLKADQFYLGDKVQSPDATGLPVKLGLAILRDRKGVIDLDLPVEGSLDDPNVRYGKLVWKVIVNLFTKIATSPFEALGKLFGGGDQDLSFIAFDSGSTTPGAEELKKLASLAKALQERPDLGLEVEAVADPATDTTGLRQAVLEAHLRQVRATTLRLPEPVAFEASERPRWIQAAFLAAFPPPPPAKEAPKKAPKAPLPPPAEMEQRLLSTLSLPDGAFARLAEERRKGMVQALRDAQVPPERIFETEGNERARNEKGSRVYFGLR